MLVGKIEYAVDRKALTDKQTSETLEKQASRDFDKLDMDICADWVNASVLRCVEYIIPMLG